MHIGLCVDGQPVLGVVYQPVRQALYHARRGGGAFLDSSGVSSQIHTSTRQVPGELRVGISRLNPDEGLGKCLAASGLAPRAVAMGASVKHMALARGDLDAVLNLSPAEQEWDTCAPEVILVEAGCTVSDGDGNPMRYNQKDLYRRRGSVASNGLCHPLHDSGHGPLPSGRAAGGQIERPGGRPEYNPANKSPQRVRDLRRSARAPRARQQSDERRACTGTHFPSGFTLEFAGIEWHCRQPRGTDLRRGICRMIDVSKVRAS